MADGETKQILNSEKSINPLRYSLIKDETRSSDDGGGNQSFFDVELKKAKINRESGLDGA